MNDLARKSVHDTTVQDIMVTDVVSVSPGDTVHEALELMLANHISAVPVTNGRGRCVGVLSATDILNLTQELEDDLTALGHTKGFAQHVLIERLSASDMAAENVEAVMTHDVIDVQPCTTVSKAAAEMVRHHVHRVIVTDDAQHLVGIVSAMDVLRVLAEEDN